MKNRILSVSYDRALLDTRHMLLTNAGFKAKSAVGFTAAIELCRSGQFDLIILGHSIPSKDKDAIMEQARKSSDAPVLALTRTGELNPDKADHHLDAAEGPESLIAKVNSILK